jgi:hypothetical protein
MHTSPLRTTWLMLNYDCCRLRKSSSPSRPWLMGNAGHVPHSSNWRPPTSPQNRLRSLARYPVNPSPAVRTRRSSGAPPAEHLANRHLSARSRSLDGLLDESKPEPPCQTETEKQLLRECEQYLSAQELDSTAEQRDVPVKEAQSCHANLDSDTVSTSSSGGARAGISQGSLLSLPLPSAGEPKRKRNFMDRCVNKVRSLIRK